VPALPDERVGEQSQPQREREGLVRLVAAERDDVLLPREPGDHLAPRRLGRRDVDDDRSSVAARDADREGIRAREGRAAVRMSEPRRRGRGQQRDEPALGETADVVAEEPRREAAARDDDPRVLGRVRELRLDRRREGEVAERAATVPARVARRRVVQPRHGGGVEAVERLEPGDPRVAVAPLASPLGVVEVPDERLDVLRREAQRVQAGPCLVRPHAG
jgi:hypothetical protein